MLTGSKTTFKVRQMLPDIKERMLSQSGVNARSRDVFGLRCLPVGPNRTKLVTPNSSLKFTPEELVLYCRDMRVICFLFDRLTPDAQVIEITYTIAKTYQPLKPGSVLSFQNAALGSVEMKQFLSNRRRDTHMNWFESALDWEQELERCGTSGWRVSSVNDRFEMSTSLPRFIVVPQKVLDTELKKSFAHFNEGRIPRWCWRHPRGSDLLRMASFQNNIYHEKDDIRNLEMVLFGCQSSLCVVVELGEELPSPADIQLAHSRLRALCLGDISTSVSVPDDKWLSTLESTHWLDYTRSCLRKASEVACLLRSGHLTVALQEAEDRDMSCMVSSLVQVMCDPHCRTQHGFQSLVQKEWVMAGHRFYSRINYHRDNDKEEAPVFLLFLDCVWQLWSQYPSRFQLTEDFLLALHDSIHLPLFSSFLANCQRERCKRSQLTDTIPGSVFLLSRGTFSCPANLLPWRSSSSGVYKKSHRRAPSSENVPGLERLLKAWSLTELPQGLTSTSGPQGPLDPYEPLLPLLMGPCMGLWRECYLRGALHAQAFSHPISANHPHPVERLAREVQQLKDKLAQVSSGSDPNPSTKTAEPRRTDTNLNQNTNNGTFLFPSSRLQGASVPRVAPPPTSTNHQTSRGSPPTSAPPFRTSHKDSGGSSKHTFLFGHSSSTEGRSDQRYYPASNNAKLSKSNGSIPS
ncbi:hypothetical protein INR49_001995 [Caranx melampygus]|nr:hypothetical protein INR49_001995 [Caranx melampygus]